MGKNMGRDKECYEFWSGEGGRDGSSPMSGNSNTVIPCLRRPNELFVVENPGYIRIYVRDIFCSGG